ncbi:hypothetical protein BH11BAC1_BH11BAC1_16380 [soil metagenome]
MKKTLLTFFVCLFFIAVKTSASCSAGFSEVIVQIIPDSWPYETSWSLVDLGGNQLDTGTSVGDTICIPTGSCAMFTIYDQYGDGIYAPGGYWVYVDGVLMAHGDSFGYQAQFAIACPPGSFCTSPIPITAYGTYTASFDDTWYTYTCDSTAGYNFTTCGLNTCNTQIWVYNACPQTPYSEGPQGTYAYNDDASCGLQADLIVMLAAGQTYYIRIGDNQNDCADSINFTFSYVGPIQGCMDPLACNYNPLAVIDDGSCIYPGNPNCAGPDLDYDSAAFVSSLMLSNFPASGCDVSEGCVTGYGSRYVITFTSKINNVGTLDYWIGNPGSQPGMFNFNNCHGHPHYEGYGDYRLIDMYGNPMPVGHKNGFCVMDLCGFGQYNCGNMGISVGCYDVYGAGTQCQWIDITDVPDGDYRLAIVINPNHLPDAMGHQEMNYYNNATQVCINIIRNAQGIPSFSLLPNCIPYLDCDGIPGGTALPDCQGSCNGPAVFGDVYNDGHLDSLDVPMYMSILENNSFPANTCNDLNNDSVLSVYDAVLANWCISTGGVVGLHNHCHFPRSIYNPSDTAGLTIAGWEMNQQYIDIEMTNTYADVKGYQFTMHGIEVQSVVSMISPVDFPADIRFNATSNDVFALSPVDSFIHRSVLPQVICRIYFSSITDTMICISSVREIVNSHAETMLNYIYGNCISNIANDIATTPVQSAGLVVIPNPATDKAMLHIDMKVGVESIKLLDLSGKQFIVPMIPAKDGWYEIDLRSLPQGVYMIRAEGQEVRGIAKLVKI